MLLVTNEFPPEMATGGIGSYMHHLAKLLHQSGHIVFVISSANAKKEAVVDRGYCINYLVPVKNDVTFRKQALKIFENHLKDVDIDIMESPEVQACGLDIKMKYPEIPMVVKLHTPGVLISKVYRTYEPFLSKARFVAGSLLRGKPDAGYWRRYDAHKDHDPEYQIAKLADTLLSPSEALRNWVSQYWSIDASGIRVVPNPFSLDESLLNCPIERQTKTICFIGKLSVLKGMVVLTSAIRKMLKKYTDYRFVICGEDEHLTGKGPSMRAWVRSQLETFSDRVEFRGRVNREEVNAILGTSEISVIPSLWENYPNVVLESMAAGAAVVAARTGGIPEIIKDRQEGLLFSPKDSNQLALCIIKLIESSAERYRMAMNARKKVCSMNACARQKDILEVYEKALHKKCKI